MPFYSLTAISWTIEGNILKELSLSIQTGLRGAVLTILRLKKGL